MLPHNNRLSRSSLRVCFNVSGNYWVDFAMFWCVSVFVLLCVPIKARRARRHPKTTLTRTARVNGIILVIITSVLANVTYGSNE